MLRSSAVLLNNLMHETSPKIHIHTFDMYTNIHIYMNSINIFEHLLYHGNVTVKELIVSF